MSRIGKSPILIPEKVEVKVNAENVVTVKGPLGVLTQKIDSAITIKIEDGIIVCERPSDEKNHKSLHGLSRALLNNMVEGVTKGYEVKQELVGVGYRANANGQNLELALGFSHPIVFQLPNEISVATETARGTNPLITLKSVDKQLIGQVAAKIRSLRAPEPYKGKGIRFQGEQIRRKAGKSAGK